MHKQNKCQDSISGVYVSVQRMVLLQPFQNQYRGIKETTRWSFLFADFEHVFG